MSRMKMTAPRLLSVRSLFAFLVAMSLVLVALAGTAQQASANTGGYPDADAVACGGQYEWCKGGSAISSRGYYYRNCTDYVAWRLVSAGAPLNKVQGLGNASQWPNSDRVPAKGIVVNTTPAAGSVAINTTAADGFGHVAYVESVSGNNITVSDYNGLGTGLYRTHTVAASTFHYFAHYEALTGAPGGGGNSASGSDFNIDGKSDIAWYTASNSTINGLISTGGGATFSSSPLVGGIGTPTWAGLGDFNGDGRSDIAWYHSYNQTLYKAYGDSAGVWHVGPVLSGLAAPTWADVGDFNIDGKSDIAWYTASSGTIKALTSTAGGATFSSSPLVGGMSVPTWADVGDFNGDGRSDIAWYHSYNQTLYKAYGDSAGVWHVGPVLAGLASPTWAETGDFNIDGKSDIAWYTASSGTIKALTSTGGGATFSSSPLVGGMGTPTWAGVGDFNGDGRSDIAWYHASSQTLHKAYGDSAGVWHVGPVLSGLASPTWAAATS